MIQNKKSIKVQAIMPERFDHYVLIKQSPYSYQYQNYLRYATPEHNLGQLRAMMETLVFNQPPSYS